jgi:YEATS family
MCVYVCGHVYVYEHVCVCVHVRTCVYISVHYSCEACFSLSLIPLLSTILLWTCFPLSFPSPLPSPPHSTHSVFVHRRFGAWWTVELSAGEHLQCPVINVDPVVWNAPPPQPESTVDADSLSSGPAADAVATQMELMDLTKDDHNDSHANQHQNKHTPLDPSPPSGSENESSTLSECASENESTSLSLSLTSESDSDTASASAAASAMPHLYLVQAHQRLDPENSHNQHAWSLRLNRKAEQCVRAVTYHLHETFPQPMVRRTSAPFNFSSRGWGTFVVRVQVELQDGAVLEAHHQLTFAENGNRVKTTPIAV